MTINEISFTKEYPIIRVSMSSASTASPGSCASTGALSCRASLSSSCLTCTETYVIDADLQDVDAFCDGTQELCRSCTSAFRFDGLAPEKKLVSSSELCRLIRGDLEKQRVAAQGTKTAAFVTPTAVRDAATGSGTGTGTATGTGSGSSPTVRRLPAQHRALIMGWMRQVSSALRLQLSTLFIATSILDRFVASSETLPPDGLLQLLALTCMSIAVKYNEVGQVAPLVWLGLAVDPLGRRLYTPRDLQRYEFTLLQAIDWQLNDPNVVTFLEHFLGCLPGPYCGHPTTCWAHNHDRHHYHHHYHPVGGPADQQADQLCQLQYTAAAAAAAAISGAETVPGAGASGVVGRRAAELAELTLMSDSFLSYDASTIALACVMAAERLALGGDADGPEKGEGYWRLLPLPIVTAAPIAVAAVCGLKLDEIAPGLESCVDTVERLCVVLGRPAHGGGGGDGGNAQLQEPHL